MGEAGKYYDQHKRTGQTVQSSHGNRNFFFGASPERDLAVEFIERQALILAPCGPCGGAPRPEWVIGGSQSLDRLWKGVGNRRLAHSGPDSRSVGQRVGG